MTFAPGHQGREPWWTPDGDAAVRGGGGGKEGASDKMQHKRRRMLIKAVHDAARELAARRYTTAPLDDDEPMPDEPVIMAFATGPYLDDKRPTPDEIRAFDGTYLDIATPDELWAAFAINTVNATRYAGGGRTAAEAKVCAWVNSHWPGGNPSVPVRVKISTKVPDGWTFELYPPPKLNPKMLLISSRAIFEHVRLTIPNVTLEEVQNTIVQSLPYKGGRRQ